MLNHKVINHFLGLVEIDTQGVYAFQTFLYDGLMQGGYRAVKSLTDVFAYRLLLFPLLISKGNHWYLPRHFTILIRLRMMMARITSKDCKPTLTANIKLEKVVRCGFT